MLFRYFGREFVFFSSRRRHTICALVTGVQTCALPIYGTCCSKSLPRPARTTPRRHRVAAWRLSQEDTPLQALHCFPAILRAFATHLGAVGAMGMGALMLSTFLCADFTSLRSEEHTSELQSLMRISYAVFCLKKK